MGIVIGAQSGQVDVTMRQRPKVPGGWRWAGRRGRPVRAGIVMVEGVTTVIAMTAA